MTQCQLTFVCCVKRFQIEMVDKKSNGSSEQMHYNSP